MWRSKSQFNRRQQRKVEPNVRTPTHAEKIGGFVQWRSSQFRMAIWKEWKERNREMENTTIVRNVNWNSPNDAVTSWKSKGKWKEEEEGKDEETKKGFYVEFREWKCESNMPLFVWNRLIVDIL